MKNNENEGISFDKICEIRKEMEEITPSSLCIEEVNPHVKYQLYEKMNSYGLALMKETLDYRVEQVEDQYHDSSVSVPRLRVTMTVSYSVMDIESLDAYGPFHVSSVDMYNMGDNCDFSKERNEWIALIAIFHLMPEDEDEGSAKDLLERYLN